MMSDLTTVATQFLITTRVFVTSFVAILLIVLIIQLWGFLEALIEYKKLKKKEQNKKNNLVMNMFLLGQLFATFMLLIVNMIMLYAVPFSNFPNLSCDALAISLACAYSVSLQMTFLFLIKKASLVSGFDRGALYQIISKLTSWLLLIFIPFFIPLAVIYDYGFVISIGMCNDSLREIWVLVILILGTLTISGMLSFLFMNPLWKVAQDPQPQIRLEAKRILRRNLVLTLIMIISSAINVGICAAFWQIVDPAHPSDQDYLLIFISLGGSLDMFTLCICSRMMTNIWLPTRLRRSVRVLHATPTSPLPRFFKSIMYDPLAKV